MTVRVHYSTDPAAAQAAGDGFIKVNTTTIVAGGPIAITSLTMTVGGA